MDSKNMKKKVTDYLLKNTDREELAKQKKELKKAYRGVLEEMADLGIAPSAIKKKNPPKEKVEEEKEKERIREIKDNVQGILIVTFMIAIGLIMGSIGLILSSHILFGILFLFLVPLLITLVIFICLRYSHTKLEDHVSILKAKMKKHENTLLIIGFIIFFVLFFIGMITIAVISSHSS